VSKIVQAICGIIGSINLSQFGEALTYTDIFIRIFTAVIIGAVIGIDREIKNRPAGMRTHVLVCVGAMMIALIEQETVANVIELDSHVINGSMGRITSTVVSGIGFLGAGTIVMSNRKVLGLTTAASLWCVACIGLTIGYGYIFIAVAVGTIVLFTLKFMQRILHVNALKKIEVEFVHRTETLSFLQEYFANMNVLILDVDFHAENKGDENVYTNLYTLSMKGNMQYVDLIGALSEYKNIRTVRTCNV
jgi:putative Mg2+ transporter-C (MgtC) family protein